MIIFQALHSSNVNPFMFLAPKDLKLIEGNPGVGNRFWAKFDVFFQGPTLQKIVVTRVKIRHDFRAQYFGISP